MYNQSEVVNSFKTTANDFLTCQLKKSKIRILATENFARIFSFQKICHTCRLVDFSH